MRAGSPQGSPARISFCPCLTQVVTRSAATVEADWLLRRSSIQSAWSKMSSAINGNHAPMSEFAVNPSWG